MNYRQTRCKAPSCLAAIFWARTDKGRKMPLDDRDVPLEEAVKDDRGLFWIDDDGTCYAWKAVMLGQDLGPIYRAHWGTCRARQEFAR